MDFQVWLEDVKKRIENNLQDFESFRLKDLFTKIEWDKLTSQEKRAFGRFFSNESKEGRLPQIISLKPGKDKQNRYQKRGRRI